MATRERRWLIQWIILIACNYCSYCFNTVIQTGECQTIDDAAFCSHVWNETFLPNVREHNSQEEALTELDDFLPLIKTRCSNAIVHFLCSVYMPHCSSTGIVSGQIIVLSPCRRVCEYARMGCEPVLALYGFSWPDHLMCDSFPLNQPCLNISDFSSIRIPSILLPSQPQPSVLAAPQTSTSTMHQYPAATCTSATQSMNIPTQTISRSTTTIKSYLSAAVTTYSQIKESSTPTATITPTQYYHVIVSSTISSNIHSRTGIAPNQQVTQYHSDGNITPSSSYSMFNEADMMTVVSASVLDDYWESIRSMDFMTTMEYSKDGHHSTSSTTVIIHPTRTSMTPSYLPTTITHAQPSPATETPNAKETNSARSTTSSYLYTILIGVFVLIAVLIPV